MRHLLVSPSAADAPPIVVLTWGLDDVAAALGITSRCFRARRAQLETAGFPRPLPALDRPRWSIEAVSAWVALSGTEG